MKKYIFTTIAMLATLYAMAQTTFWVYKKNGTQIECVISEIDSISIVAPSSHTGVKDICGNRYPIITIGTQTWMAENMRCDKYDTNSERAGETLPTSESLPRAPYYTDASNKSLWNDFSNEYGVYLTNDQINKLGYLYSWAAAVGLATAEEYQNQTAAFHGNRQGICPNGWHVPTEAEWNTLKTFIEKTDGKGKQKSGTHLKTKEGWYEDDSYMAGRDTYFFSALPSGCADGSDVGGVGYIANFWSSTPSDNYYNSIYGYGICYNNEDMYSYTSESGAQAVRCLKD